MWFYWHENATPSRDTQVGYNIDSVQAGEEVAVEAVAVTREERDTAAEKGMIDTDKNLEEGNHERFILMFTVLVSH